jgi:hypothetical protein
MMAKKGEIKLAFLFHRDCFFFFLFFLLMRPNDHVGPKNHSGVNKMLSGFAKERFLGFGPFCSKR